MAKTWTVNEAYNAIKNNDAEGIADFGKRFPLATTALAKAGTNAGLDVLFGAMPDRTMRILEMQLKDGVTVSDDDEAEEVAEEKPVKTEKKAKAEKKAEKPAKAEKVEKKAAPKKSTKKAEPVEEDDEDEAEDDGVDYKSMSPVELFKLCKKRGIKVEPKQKSSVYIKALEAADNGSDDDADDEDDSWDI